MRSNTTEESRHAVCHKAQSVSASSSTVHRANPLVHTKSASMGGRSAPDIQSSFHVRKGRLGVVDGHVELRVSNVFSSR